jgi:hypothetical protein
MQRLGWVEGRNLVVDRRFMDGNLDRLAHLMTVKATPSARPEAR